MFLEIAKKNYQLFWTIQQKNLDMIVQAQEATTETCAKLIQISIEKNLDALEEFSQKIKNYEDSHLAAQQPSDKKSSSASLFDKATFFSKNKPTYKAPVLLGLTRDFFISSLKNLTFSRKSLLKLLRDHYFSRGFEMTKKITKTCSLSLMGLMSTVSGRAITSESVSDYTVSPIHNVEAISLRNHKAPATATSLTIALQQAQDYAARRQANEKMLAAFIEAKRQLDSERETLQSQQEAKWNKAQQELASYSPEWYEVQIEKYTAYAEWYPDFASDYKRRAAEAKEERANLIRNAEIRAKEEEWDTAKSAMRVYSPEWYRVEVERYTAYAKWYPDQAEYYREQATVAQANATAAQQQASRDALEEQWNTRQAAVDRESAEWYEIQAERYTKYAEWYPDDAEYYRNQVGVFREEMRTAPERAARARQEEEWRQREVGAWWGSADWYEIQAERNTRYAEWNPGERAYYLGQAEMNRASAQRIRENEADRLAAEQRERERREAAAREAEALRLEEERLTAERANIRARLNADWEADLARIAGLAPTAAYEVLKDRLFTLDGYHEPLEAMRSGNALAPRTTAETTAVKKALWNKLHGFVEAQAPLNPDAATLAEQKYFNVIKFLTETQAPDLVIGADPIDDAAWTALEDQTKQLAADVGFTDADLVGAPSHWGPGTNWISEWFNKLMQCQQARGSEAGKNFVRNRAKKIIEYLQALRDEDDENDEKIKLILQKDIIDNAQNCSDRALSGLDNAEVNIKIAEAASPEQALGAVVQKLKKSIIEVILDRTQHEIVEEYLYLALMFNKHLALGMPHTEMTYAGCGARKTFDEALAKILENVHYQGAVDMLLAEESWMEALKKLSPEYADEAERAMETRIADTEEAAAQVARGSAPIDAAFEDAKRIAAQHKTTALAPIAADIARVTAIEDACKTEVATAKDIKDRALAALPDGGDDTPIFDAFFAAKQAAEDRKAAALIPLQATVDEIKRIQRIYDAEIDAARTTRRTALNPIEDASAQRTEEIEATYHRTIKAAAERLTKEIFDREFVVTGSKYAGITGEHIAQIEDAIRADNTSPQQLLDRARARLAELEAPIETERARLNAAIRTDAAVIEDITALQETARSADIRLNELTTELMERDDVWDIEIIKTYPEFIAAKREYKAATAAYQAAAARDTLALRERIRANTQALTELNARAVPREVTELQQEIRRLEDELRPAHRWW